MHFALEPVNALAFEKNGVFEIHTGNQWQTLILPVLAKALGRSQDKIVLRSYLLGGGFGRRLDGDYAVPGCARRQSGRQTGQDGLYARGRHALRLPAIACGAGSADGLRRWRQGDSNGSPGGCGLAYGSHGSGVHAQRMTSGVPFDPFASHGADHWYTVGAQRVRAIQNDLAQRTFRPGWLRSVGGGWIYWALESFMDEAAHDLGVDPVAFRLRLLDGVGRNAGSAPNSVGGAHTASGSACSRRRKGRTGEAPCPMTWDLAWLRAFGQERDMPTWCACVARVRVDRTSGQVTVEKLTLVVDAGTIIQPDGAAAQVEGSALWGLSMALYEGSEFVMGQPKDTNLDTYTLLRMGNVPEVEIEFMPSTEAPVGLGEPATAVIAPAIGNAIFAATGARLRHLPIRPEDVRQALAHRI